MWTTTLYGTGHIVVPSTVYSSGGGGRRHSRGGGGDRAEAVETAETASGVSVVQ